MARPNIFQAIELPKPKRSKFDLSHERKMSIPFGALIPTLTMEVLPGDSFRVDAKILARFQASLAPFMHRVNVFTHYYFVPYRILNRNWTRFITYQGNRPNLSQSVSESPYFTYTVARTSIVNGASGNAFKDGSLFDYLGFPTAPNDVTFSAPSAPIENVRLSALLPLAYQRIWNDYYRDPNFTNPLFDSDPTGMHAQSGGTSFYFEDITNFDTVNIQDPESLNPANTVTRFNALATLRWRAWEKDYLTSALPYANQGVADPRVPVTIPAFSLGNSGSPQPLTNRTVGQTGGIQYPGSVNNPSDGGGFTVSALRIAAALKRWLENTARGGSRYADHLWNHWFVKSDDARMMVAEYLGGGMQPMVISEVVTTAPNSDGQPGVVPGYLAGHGISYGNTNRFTRRFKEHGVVMGITSVLPRTAYLYSLPRAWMRSEPLDFAFPEFAQLGEQPVLGAEAFFKLWSNASTSAPNYTAATPSASAYGIVNRFNMGFVAPAAYSGFDLQNDNPEGSTSSIWGYQSRYAEYKYMPDTVHGLFRNNLSFWHFGRMLTPMPTLNNAFVTSNPRMDGFSVLPNNGGSGQYNQHPILLNVYNRVSVIRALPYYNNPALW